MHIPTSLRTPTQPDKIHGFHPELYVQIPAELATAGILTDIHSGDLPVYGMTVLDTINLRTADALFNGTAVAQLIENCVPNIKNAWLLPFSSINYLLTAIDIATSGHTTEISLQCPECKEENNYDIPLSDMLDKIQTSAIEPLQFDMDGSSVHFKFKSLIYKFYNEFNLNFFRNQKTYEQLKLSDKDTDDQEIMLKKIVDDINHNNFFWLAHNTQEIYLDGNLIAEDYESIYDILKDLDRQSYKQVESHLKTYMKNLTPDVAVECRDCSHQFQTSFSLDYCNSFRSSLLNKNEEEIKEYLTRFEQAIGDIKKDILKSVWFMRGGVTYSEILRMTVKERKLIGKLVEENIKTTKESGLPFF